MMSGKSLFNLLELALNPSARPGDCVIWKTEDGTTPAIVQSVNARARTADIRIAGQSQNEHVPLLELDAYGSGGAAPTAISNFDSLGVRRSDFVFIHAEGTTNGAEKGRVPRIGEMPEWAKDHNEMAPWRELMRVKGEELAKSRHTLSPKDHCTVKKADKSDPSFKWLGEVVDVSN
jgi:ubiquitin-conjugating enzyme E2 O